MKRAVVFAHYDINSIIDDYVIYYLKELKKVSEYIVFASCQEISEAEKSKLNGIANFIISESHNEYDFGSYKRGFQHLENNNILDNLDELIFANDSCYGPFHPLDKIFAEMEKKDCDFWGISKNNFGYSKEKNHRFFLLRPHVQSYFIVFNKEIIQNDAFRSFINSIKHEEDKRDIISNYEIGLSEFLVENGYKYSTYIEKYGYINNITILKWRQIIEKAGMPFMKCSLPRLVNKNSTTVEGYQKIIAKVSNYPVSLIEANVARTKIVKNSRITMPVWIKRLFFDSISVLPFVIRKTFALFIARCLPFMRD